MKRVLYIAYFYPPLGGAGVQRSSKFVRYLPQFGIEPTVLTARANYWIADPSLLDDVPAGVEVIRAPHWGSGTTQRAAGGGSRSASRLSLMRRVARWLLVPDAYWGWILPAERAALRTLRAQQFDAILTTSSPDSTHLLGLRLRQRTGLPWLADFRDPWVRRLSYAPPTSWHDRWQRRMEREVVSSADRVLVTSDATRDDFAARYPELPASRFVTLTNGYDREDFAAAATWLERGGATESEGRLVHAGQLNPERDIEPLLRGLRLRLDRGDTVDPLLFLGAHYDRHRELAARLGLEALVRFQDNVPHLESIAACLRAKALLLLEQPSERGALILPGKIFEYLRAGRPILALVPGEGAAARLIRSVAAGVVVDPLDPVAIAEGLAKVGSIPTVLHPRGEAETDPGILQFERRALTSRLAALIEEVTAR